MTTPNASGPPKRPALRRARRQRGWSQNDAAGKVYELGIELGIAEKDLGVDGRQFSRWENGKSQPNQTYTALLCRLYEALPDQLDLPPFVLPIGPAQPSPPQATSSASELVDSEDVKRREFAKLLALTGAAASGLDLERLAGVLSGARVDGPGLDDLETLTVDLVRREATLAPDVLLPAVRGHLQGLRDVLVWTPSSLAARAYSLAGQTALLAGYLMFKQEKHAEADLYWSLADRFGEMAGDVRLRAALLVLQGWRWQDENHPLSLALLNRAESLLGPTPEPTTAAYVLSTRAARNAEASHADPACATLAMRDIDHAHRHLSRMHADTGIYIIESVRGEAIERRAGALVHLGRPHEGAVDLQQLLASIDPASLSWRSYVTKNLAAAVARMGEAEHACELLTTSLQLATDARAPVCVQKVRDTRQRWLAGYDGPAARLLDEHLLAASPPNSALPPS